MYRFACIFRKVKKILFIFFMTYKKQKCYLICDKKLECCAHFSNGIKYLFVQGKEKEDRVVVGHNFQ
jgi:hypothetical protein